MALHNAMPKKLDKLGADIVSSCHCVSILMISNELKSEQFFFFFKRRDPLNTGTDFSCTFKGILCDQVLSYTKAYFSDGFMPMISANCKYQVAQMFY